jgi:hypothetical protein
MFQDNDFPLREVVEKGLIIPFPNGAAKCIMSRTAQLNNRCRSQDQI